MQGTLFLSPLLFAIISINFANSTSLFKGDVTIDGPANCRDKPQGKIIKSMANGEKVTVVDQKGDWLEVRSKNMTCWTFKTNLKLPTNESVSSEKFYGDSLSEEDNDFLESISVPNPPLSEMLGVEG
jgi:hypothetical protein